MAKLHQWQSSCYLQADVWSKAPQEMYKFHWRTETKSKERLIRTALTLISVCGAPRDAKEKILAYFVGQDHSFGDAL